jgi:methionyl-tRNA formyltransferase
LSTVFLGTSAFAAAILERLAGSAAHSPVLVLTRPDRRSGRGRQPTTPPVAERARSLGIALEQPESVNDPAARALIAEAAASREGGPSIASAPGQRPPATVVVCAFGALIKEPLLSEHLILNVHPSLLPRWRGAAPIERAIMAGDARTGVSIMRLTAGLDSGPVCLARSEPIRPEDTYGSLASRLQDLGGELLLEALEQEPAFIDQAEDGVTYAEKIAPEDRLLDPTRPAAELERVVRALQPHIGARVELPDGTLLGVHRAALESATPAAGEPSDQAAASAAPDHGGERPSVVWAKGDRLWLSCEPGLLELLMVQPPGGRAMDAGAYLRGHGPPGRA